MNENHVHVILLIDIYIFLVDRQDLNELLSMLVENFVSRQVME